MYNNASGTYIVRVIDNTTATENDIFLIFDDSDILR